jgi:hypothetical protein
MDREEFKEYVSKTLGPEVAEFFLAMFGDAEFEVLGMGSLTLPPETLQETIQREAWEQMYPVTYSAGGHKRFPSHVH